jgi:hypothetical protein
MKDLAKQEAELKDTPELTKGLSNQTQAFKRAI